MPTYADPLVSAGAIPEREIWPRFDGDLDMFRDIPIGINQRCAQRNVWPAREDLVWPLTTEYDENGVVKPLRPSPRSRWHMLNESYDLLVIPCSEEGMHARYNKDPTGKTMWERANAFSLHLSPGDEPKCEPSREEQDLPACVREVWGLWRGFLNKALA
eukprot:c41039_g1_i1.p1 GENE.c41039_g1_i1~~c41039_g1_i1.p1  ORF type:complete len:159 (+),score=30.29 c41039_g1_i1:37-513(+)